MVSEDSDLYRAHPDWAMEIPGRHAVRSRNQLVLDVGRKEVQDYLIERDNVQIVASGMAFMHAGIPIPREIPEFTAFIYHLTAIDWCTARDGFMEDVCKTAPVFILFW